MRLGVDRLMWSAGVREAFFCQLTDVQPERVLQG